MTLCYTVKTTPKQLTMIRATYKGLAAPGKVCAQCYIDMPREAQRLQHRIQIAIGHSQHACKPSISKAKKQFHSLSLAVTFGLLRHVLN